MRPLSVKKSESMACGRRLTVEAGAHGVTRPTTDQMHAHQLECAVLCATFSCVLLRPAGLQPLQSEAGDFARVFQIEFVFDVRSVRLHGLRAEMQ